jgi:2-C-methyl-D-erythritol 4-phosphate cytidylyltransferase
MPGRILAIVPAAGLGSRMQSDRPKQYLPLADKTVLEQTLAKLDAVNPITEIIVALSAEDPFWNELKLELHKPLRTVVGGRERMHSVLNAVLSIPDLDENDWLLVHDAARPCVHPENIIRLIEQLQQHTCGGLLAVPVADTLKSSDSSRQITATVDRSGLWQAQTPQLFRATLLRDALLNCIERQIVVTDEASALEAMGYSPLLVEGRTDNLKITRAEDLVLAEFYLQREAM